ncbi:enoyl-CoA hydratase/carnithine racemase [Streptosporangium becharense]|uniref:Enoyl-CoA hydratase/carnithine racemase n=1 Tax=Streptosporangium becharense TaxID=1816182 RepID=A0A7W9INF3_9ACTN|nr:enoyl-CoA hydratase/isomerase family protein [Streptosporangium becharense]MBB2914373.1 enoyl-CoA hydratase/carnithine racemase [Streptosporangium becharense]MBB5823595.1 enoyl-CoA hydratase/carnithine racemase [Streptosporangium becharense]
MTADVETRSGPVPEPDLSVTVEGGVGLVEMRRPPANFFDEHLIGRIVDAARELDGTGECRVLVLASAGKHFCAGADFGEGGGFDSDRVAVSERLYRRAAQLFEIRIPIIAAVQGAAVGGGLGLACAADFRVADVNSRFVANFALLGFHQGFGLSVTLPDIVGRQAAAGMLLTGRPVRGQEACRIGLADRLAEPGRQREQALAWAGELAAAAPLAVRSIRSTLRADLARRVREALEHELAEQSRLWATGDCAEGIAASLERRPPVFRGE